MEHGDKLYSCLHLLRSSYSSDINCENNLATIILIKLDYSANFFSYHDCANIDP